MSADIELASQLEGSRFGTKLGQFVLDSSNFETAPVSTDLLLPKLTSFCGRYGSRASSQILGGSSKRYDVSTMLKEHLSQSTLNEISRTVYPRGFTGGHSRAAQSANAIEVYVVINPLTRAGQRAASVM